MSIGVSRWAILCCFEDGESEDLSESLSNRLGQLSKLLAVSDGYASAVV
jgi:hypothetical protein